MENKCTDKPVPNIPELKYKGTVDKPDIKIFVSHRIDLDSEPIDNPLYIPMRCGAVYDERENVTLLGDDTGVNISEKRMSFCELTIQYWAWKNVSADYYGLCHYRRYLCFADISKLNIVRNERGHIVAYALDEINIDRFGLENSSEMRAAIEGRDAVVGELQKVSDLYTPRGKKSTAYEHWVAHNRDLIFKKDLDRMLEILCEKNPKLGKSAREYLGQGSFLGFNCFILKKELFDELCETEFSVLEALESELDLSNYTQQQSRIFGFMGEIICSAFIYRLEREKKYVVKHVPVLYFENTSKIQEIKPIEKDNCIHLIFLHGREPLGFFAVTLQSFLDNVETSYFYDIVAVMPKLEQKSKSFLDDMVSRHPNVSMRYADFDFFEGTVKEHFGDVSDIMPFIPYLFRNFKRALVFSANVMFERSVLPLWNESLGENIIVSPIDAFMQGKVNDIHDDTAFKPLKKFMKNPADFHSCHAMLWDFEKYRTFISEESVIALCEKLRHEPRFFGEGLNILCAGKIKEADISFATCFFSNSPLKYFLPRCSLQIYKQLTDAQKAPSVICYQTNDPFYFSSEFSPRFWHYARQTPFYEEILCRMNYEIANLEAKEMRNRINRLEKISGIHFLRKAKNFLKRNLPSDSLAGKITRKIYHKIRRR